MDDTSRTGVCSVCGEKRPTNMYHGAKKSRAPDEVLTRKIELCRECFDQVLAREQVNYWKEHIAEERRRTRANR